MDESLDPQLRMAAIDGDHASLCEALAAGADPRLVDHEGEDALMLAAVGGDRECIQTLLALCDPMAKNACQGSRAAGRTALMRAALAGQVGAVRQLMGVSDPLAKSATGKTALMMGAIADSMLKCSRPMPADQSCFAALLPVSDPRADLGSGLTPLMMCVRLKFQEGFDAILPLSDPLAVDRSGQSALMLAAACGQERMARALLPISDSLARDARGFLASECASECGHHELAAWFEAAQNAERVARIAQVLPAASALPRRAPLSL